MYLFMLGVTTLHEIIKQLGNRLITRAKSQGLKASIGEATNPKLIRFVEKYGDTEKYQDLDGDFIVHKYTDNSKLNGIPSNI